MSGTKYISTPAQKNETKQHLLSLPDKFSPTDIDRIKLKNKIKSIMEVPTQISAIAKIIRQDWKNLYFGAVPYLNAMSEIEDIKQMYHQDSAESIVRYFLANASTRRGEVAKTVKAKLKQLLND